MGERRRRFTWEFKVEAVRLVHESGKPQAQVARELGIRPDMLRDWRRQVEARTRADAGGATGPAGSVEEENRRLRRENEILRQERDFLKKAAAFFAKESR